LLRQRGEHLDAVAVQHAAERQVGVGRAVRQRVHAAPDRRYKSKAVLTNCLASLPVTRSQIGPPSASISIPKAREGSSVYSRTTRLAHSIQTTGSLGKLSR